MGVTVAHGLAIVGDYGGKVHALAISDGRQIWQASVGGQLYAGIAEQDGRLFVSSSTGKDLTALRVTTGKELWRSDLHDFAFSGPAVAGDVVVNGSYDGHLRAFDTRTGALLWDVDFGDKIYGTPQIVNGVVWAADFGGKTEALALGSGKRLQTWHHGRYPGTSGDVHTLLLLGFSRIWGLR
jgi:outer membrane protein assembly factor BamB